MRSGDPTFVTFSLKGRWLNLDQQLALAEALEGNTNLTTLRLNDCSIAGAGARALAKALERNNTLTILDLENNKIDSEGIAAIADSLRTNVSLQELVLLGNTVPGERAMSCFINALEYNTTLLSIKWRVTSRQSFRVNSGITRNNEILRRQKAGMSVDDIHPQKIRERDELIRAERNDTTVSAPPVEDTLLTSEQIAAADRSRREAELKRIEGERKGGPNVFQEMERQREEERRRKYLRTPEQDSGSSEQPAASEPKKVIASPFAELEKKEQEEKLKSRFTPTPTAVSPTPAATSGTSPAKVKSNPFLEMERKREEERKARFARFSGQN